jgi:hypothetical protein
LLGIPVLLLFLGNARVTRKIHLDCCKNEKTLFSTIEKRIKQIPSAIEVIKAFCNDANDNLNKVIILTNAIILNRWLKKLE